MRGPIDRVSLETHAMLGEEATDTLAVGGSILLLLPHSHKRLMVRLDLAQQGRRLCQRGRLFEHVLDILQRPFTVVQGSHPRCGLLAARIVSDSQIVRLPRLGAHGIQWGQHLDSALPLLTLHRHPTIGSQEVNDIHDVRCLPWRLLQPRQGAVGRERYGDRRCTDAGKGQSKCLIEYPFSLPWRVPGLL